MRIAVTGGAGFIGSHVVEQIVARGHEALVIDDFSSGSPDNLASVRGAIEIEQQDVCNGAACARLLSAWRPDAVLHLAAIASVVRSIEEPRLTHEVNLNGAFNLLEAARDAGVRRFVFASSAAVYGLLPALPSAETDPLAPVSPYAAQKAAGEALCRAYRSAWGLETAALRFFNVFGERQRADSPYSGVISLFLEALSTHGQATISGDGEQSRDFIYVGDVARAVVAALTRSDPGFGPFNIARGEQTSIRALYTLVANATGSADAPLFAPARPGDVRHSRAQIAGMRGVLGVEPAVAVVDGIARLAAWRTAAQRGR